MTVRALGERLRHDISYTESVYVVPQKPAVLNAAAKAQVEDPDPAAQEEEEMKARDVADPQASEDEENDEHTDRTELPAEQEEDVEENDAQEQQASDEEEKDAQQDPPEPPVQQDEEMDEDSAPVPQASKDEEENMKKDPPDPAANQGEEKPDDNLPDPPASEHVVQNEHKDLPQPAAKKDQEIDVDAASVLPASEENEKNGHKDLAEPPSKHGEELQQDDRRRPAAGSEQQEKTVEGKALDSHASVNGNETGGVNTLTAPADKDLEVNSLVVVPARPDCAQEEEMHQVDAPLSQAGSVQEKYAELNAQQIPAGSSEQPSPAGQEVMQESPHTVVPPKPSQLQPLQSQAPSPTNPPLPRPVSGQQSLRKTTTDHPPTMGGGPALVAPKTKETAKQHKAPAPRPSPAKQLAAALEGKKQDQTQQLQGTGQDPKPIAQQGANAQGKPQALDPPPLMFASGQVLDPHSKHRDILSIIHKVGMQDPDLPGPGPTLYDLLRNQPEHTSGAANPVRGRHQPVEMLSTPATRQKKRSPEVALPAENDQASSSSDDSEYDESDSEYSPTRNRKSSTAPARPPAGGQEKTQPLPSPAQEVGDAR